MKQKSKTTTTRKTAIAAAVCAALGIAATPSADATVYELRFDGASLGAFFTMLDPGGDVFRNSAPGVQTTTYYGYRTPIGGTITWDTTANSGAGGGTMIVSGFSFGSGGFAVASNVTLQAIGDGNCTSTGCGPGNLVLGNMGFTWGPNTGIPVPIVWDATGLLAAINSGTLAPDDMITGGVNAASENSRFPSFRTGIVYPMGLLPMAATEFNTSATGITTGCSWTACNPSGTLPLIVDTMADAAEDTTFLAGDKVGVPGSPMPAGPFPGFNANFDFKVLTVLTVDGVGSSTPPAISGTLPANGAVNIVSSTLVTASFTKLMKADTVAAAFSLVNETAGGTPVAGTLSPSGAGQSAFSFTFTPAAPLSYLNTYRATISTVAKDTNNNNLPAPVTWSFTIQAKPAGQSCATPTSNVPLGSNFSMLDSAGTVFGGTNDIVYNLNFGALNTSVTGTNGIMTNTLASDGPHPFFGSPWVAHHIRLFAPGGPYVINTVCSTGQLETGTCTPNTDTTKNLTFTVGSGQIGVHMLFNWSGNNDIDVVNVWDHNAAWVDPDNATAPTQKNDLWLGDRWLGPTGFGVDPAVIWDYVTTDSDGDGKVGISMVDGPFIGFNADFNLGPHSSCVAVVNTIVMTVDESNAKVGGPSCSMNSLSNKSHSPSMTGDFWLVAGFLAWLRLVVKRGRKKLARG